MKNQLFRIIPDEAHISRVTNFKASVSYSDWKAINAQGLIGPDGQLIPLDISIQQTTEDGSYLGNTLPFSDPHLIPSIQQDFQAIGIDKSSSKITIATTGIILSSNTWIGSLCGLLIYYIEKLSIYSCIERFTFIPMAYIR